MMNYKNLMKYEPFELHSMVNSKGQTISFLEHPLQGDMVEVICACHELGLAEYSTFFDLDDMIAEHKEYEPSFKDGRLYIGDMLVD